MHIPNIDLGPIQGPGDSLNIKEKKLFMTPELPENINFAVQNRKIELPLLQKLGVSKDNASLFFGAVIERLDHEEK